MCRCRAQPNALCPHVEMSAVAVVVLALAWLKKNNNNNNNQKMNCHWNFGPGKIGPGPIFPMEILVRRLKQELAARPRVRARD